MNKLVFIDVEFGNKFPEVSKNEFYLGEVDVNKVFIGYMDNIGGSVEPLCIILPQMSGWIK